MLAMTARPALACCSLAISLYEPLPVRAGCFDHEEEAARAYDKMMLWCELHNAAGVKSGITNFDPLEYEKEFPWLQSITQVGPRRGVVLPVQALGDGGEGATEELPREWTTTPRLSDGTPVAACPLRLELFTPSWSGAFLPFSVSVRRTS